MNLTTDQLAEILKAWYDPTLTRDMGEALPHFIAKRLKRLDPNFDAKGFVEATGEPYEARRRILNLC